jgi:hypothetical protein
MNFDQMGRTIPDYDPSKDPYLDTRLRSEHPITFLGFIDEMKRLWTMAGKKGKIIRHQPFDEESEFPCITFRTIRRMINQNFHETKPRYRATIYHPYIPGEYVELKGQMFDVWVQFDVCSTSAEEADELVEELDDFLYIYKGFFKKNGVQEMTFYAQLEDSVITDYRFPIAVRPIQYTLRFEKITPVFLNQIEQIYTQASIQPQHD